MYSSIKRIAFRFHQILSEYICLNTPEVWFNKSVVSAGGSQRRTQNITVRSRHPPQTLLQWNGEETLISHAKILNFTSSVTQLALVFQYLTCLKTSRSMTDKLSFDVGLQEDSTGKNRLEFWAYISTDAVFCFLHVCVRVFQVRPAGGPFTRRPNRDLKERKFVSVMISFSSVFHPNVILWVNRLFSWCTYIPWCLSM